MRLRPADAAALIRQTGSERTVLVGGQAVAFWADHFGIPPRLPALTVDIDYLGTRREAQRAHARLEFPHRLDLASPEDLPNTAVLSVQLEGYDEPIQIDYLATLVGLDSSEIAKTAVTVQVEGEPLKIIHPLALLKSKIWNLYQLRQKRTPAGIEQARLSIEIVSALLGSDAFSRRDTLRAIENLGRFARTQPARYAREHHRLDCLSAVSARLLRSNRLPAAFRETRWPQIVAAAK